MPYWKKQGVEQVRQRLEDQERHGGQRPLFERGFQGLGRIGLGQIVQAQRVGGVQAHGSPQGCGGQGDGIKLSAVHGKYLFMKKHIVVASIVAAVALVAGARG